MADKAEDKPVEPPADKPALAKTKTKAPSRYVVAEGRSLAFRSKVAMPGDEITADEVADLEALIKGGYVVKA